MHIAIILGPFLPVPTVLGGAAYLVVSIVLRIPELGSMIAIMRDVVRRRSHA